MRKDINAPFYIKYGFSILAASCSEMVTYPLDLAKTRLQIQGEKNLNLGKKKGLVGMCSEVIRKEGIFRLYFGMSPAIYRHVVYTGFRMTAYQHFRSKLSQNPGLLQTAGLGMACGAAGQILANPFDVVKVQMQNEGKRILQGLEARTINHSFSGYWRAAVKAGGYRSLMLGCIPNAQRSALVNLGDLTAYDNSKNRLISLGFSENFWLFFISSASAGLVSAILGTPADVVKTRMMNQPINDQGKGIYYKSSIDCLNQAVKNEGFLSLYKGFVPCWMRMAPWSMTFWFAYETLCSTAGYKSV